MFLDFITDALHPRIERDYSTTPSGQDFNDREILGDLAVHQNPAKNVATSFHRLTSRGGSVTSALMHESHVTLVDRVDRTGCGASSRSGPRMIASGYVTTFLFRGDLEQLPAAAGDRVPAAPAVLRSGSRAARVKERRHRPLTRTSHPCARTRRSGPGTVPGRAGRSGRITRRRPAPRGNGTARRCDGTPS